ncbi:glycosyltransferase [Subtercola sp. Z020]|uniref:glycosyltransferase n=1 Tax=Subtercola sp. Z020 TaxID=2080582 RepID=UPI0011B0517D|nr:nucleotide disphospho-sugar-binding domain-containing protein [Subtercola sp. Z020]
MPSVLLCSMPADGIRDALARETVDAVLHEPTFVGIAGLQSLAPALRPLTVMCGILPLGISSRDTAPFGLGLPPRSGITGRMRNGLLRWVARAIILRPVHRQADEVLRQLGAPPLGGRFFLDLLASDDLLAQFTVPDFEYHRSDAPANLEFFGPLLPRSSAATTLPPWWPQLGDSRPVIHVSQGTVANQDFGELIRPTLRALAAEDVTIVVTTGGRPLGDLPELPANAFAAEFIPYDTLMPKTDVFVTNGGYGGLHSAMRYGVPVVVAGDTEDKVETSARVAWAGVGVNLKTRGPSPRSVNHAVHRVLNDPGFARRSALIGESIQAAPGVAGFAASLERLIEARGARP